MKKTWTYLLTDGEEFEISIKGNPTVFHNGEISVWTLHLTEQMKENLEKFLDERNQSYQSLTTNEELEKKTKKLVRNHTSFHCSQCFNCCWFEFTSPNKCSAMDLPHKAVLELIEDKSTEHSIDYNKCPILNGKNNEY